MLAMIGKVLLGKVLEPFWRALKALLGWVLSDIRHVLIVALLGVSVFVWADRNGWRDAAYAWERAAKAWQKAHGQLVTDVQHQREVAAELDRQNVARVEAEFAELNEGIVNDYEARLARSAAAADSLRHDLDIAARNNGDSGAADLPAPDWTRSQIAGAAAGHGLLLVDPDFVAEAQANTDKLVSLQEYVNQSLLVEFSGDD
jgi:hypothetical protein